MMVLDPSPQRKGSCGFPALLVADSSLGKVITSIPLPLDPFQHLPSFRTQGLASDI